MEVHRLATELGFGEEFRDQTCQLFRTAQDRGLLVGRSIEAMAGACIYAMARCNHLPRMIQEITAMSAVDSARIEHAYTVLNRELALLTPPPRPVAYLQQFASQLDVSAETRRQAEEVAEVAEEGGLVNGRNPAGVAAACLYIASRDRLENWNGTVSP